MTSNDRFTFKESERLKGKTTIDKLYKEGKSFVAFPFFVTYSDPIQKEGSQVLISVSKRRFKNATDRNTAKRRIREAYRLNKHRLEVAPMQIAFNYIAPKILDFHTIEQKLISTFKRLNKLNQKVNGGG